MEILVDANIILDIWEQDIEWAAWSAAKLDQCASIGTLVVNQIICTEVAPSFKNDSDLEGSLDQIGITLSSLPFSVSLPASRAFQKYKKRGGTKTNVLSDFLIGAHAEMSGLTVLTRDVARFQSYFPSVPLICP